MIHSPVRRLLSLAALGVAGAVLLAGPAAAALQNPTAPAAAPAVVEALSPYLPQTSCDPTAKPGTAALRTLLLETYGGRDLGIIRNCAIGATSEHKEGRAFDWGLNVTVPAEKAIADQFLTWLLAAGPDGTTAYNARRLGIMYMIWDGRIWGSYGSGWKAYNGGEAHTDHIHISLSWAGAMKRTSFWTGKAAATDYGPCRKYVGLPTEKYSVPRTSATCPPAIAPMSLTGTPVLEVGSTGGYVAQLQMLLKVGVDGDFGTKTDAALKAFQTAQSLPATGSTDATTWSRLRAPKPVVTTPAPVTAPVPAPVPAPAVKTPVAAPLPLNKALAPYAALTLTKGATGAAVVALQKALRITADGAFGAKTAAAALTFNKAHGLTPDGVVRPATWRALGAPAPVAAPAPAPKPVVTSALAPYARLTLKQGATGAAVVALQKALRITADGAFGAKTTAAVLAFNKAHKLPADGVVRPATWLALGAPAPVTRTTAAATPAR